MRYNSEEQNAELEAFRKKYACDHESTEVRKRVLKSGSIAYWPQCVMCGKATGHAVKADVAQKMYGENDPPDFDEQLKKRWIKRRDIEYKKIFEKYDDKYDYKRAQFFKWYSKYLNSDEWEIKRKKVFLRAQGICEGCRECKAAEVHHVSYRNVGNEFLFELVALCPACHERYHGSFGLENDGYELNQVKKFKKMFGE